MASRITEKKYTYVYQTIQIIYTFGASLLALSSVSVAHDDSHGDNAGHSGGRFKANRIDQQGGISRCRPMRQP